MEHIVTLGGGTGSLTLLKGLQKENCTISTILSMADDGGSTGRMRQMYNMPAFGGDFRDALLGLSADKNMSDLFYHRFSTGEELTGHSLGNIILLGLYQIHQGSIPEALTVAHDILNAQGSVLPSTLQNIELSCKYSNNTIITSQNKIDNDRTMLGEHVVDCRLTPAATAYDDAVTAILSADKIVLGPGDIYSNIVANILVDGIREAIIESNAKKIYVCNLMNKKNQTAGMKSADYLKEIEKYLLGKLDYVLVNDETQTNLNFGHTDQAKYRELVSDNLFNSKQLGETQVIKDSFTKFGELHKKQSGDVIPRSFLRHDGEKLAKAILEI